MNKRFFIILALLLFSWEAWAISAQEAVNFATKQNNLLYEGETPDNLQVVRITDSGKAYWVIMIPSGDRIKGFIPVLDSTNPALPDSIIARRNLIKTAYFLWNYVNLKTDVAEQARLTRLNLWLFDAASVSDFLELSADFKNEKTDLTTVKSELKDCPELQQDVDSLILRLDEMRAVADAISDSLLETTSFQARFESKPDTNSLEEFEEMVDFDFDMVDELETILIHDPEEKQLSYFEELDSLSQAIALTNLPLQTKQGLNSLTNVPNSFQKFNSKTNFWVGFKDKFNQIFINALANVDNFIADLLTREKRNNAFQVMYGYDEEVLLKTGQNTLNQLFELLLDNEYFFLWVNQTDLLNAKQDWEKAKSFYNSGEFQQAEQYAAKAKKPALSAYEAGLKSQQPVFDTDLIFGVIALLIIAGIIIYVLKNRGRISDLVSGKEEEVQLRDWSE